MSKYLENLGVYDLGSIRFEDDSVLLYAPLSCKSLTVSPRELLLLESAAAGESPSEEYNLVLRALTDYEAISRIRRLEDFVNLSILPTNSCNFACSYCYSAKGRSNRTIDFAVVDRMIRYFVGLERRATPSLHITIFGGGEPMLCWEDIVRPAIMVIEELRQFYPANIHITLITNGSILPPDFFSVCKTASVDLSVSFDILEVLQNYHRGHFSLVSDNISTLCSLGLVPAINSVISDEAVSLMPKMIVEAVSKYPKVKYLSFEPETGEHTMEFYNKFTENFFEAKSLADALGVKLTTSALRNVDVTVERYCAGELALNAIGDITACPCLSSPDQPGYNRWVYGHASANEITIDSNRLDSILRQDVNSQSWCQHCFARYNCGGGCLNNALERDNKPDINYCRFFKNFLRKVIIDRSL